MKVAGIIAEYNPFHNGHAYLLQKARERTGADYCVAVMSGDFVQRGAPAIFDKYTRARMALMSGADLVLELPAAFSCGSAEDFAACGAALLERLGVVDTLCFGSECGQTEPLMELARLFCEEPEDYRRVLTDELKNGLSFPQARAKAAETYLAARTLPAAAEGKEKKGGRISGGGYVGVQDPSGGWMGPETACADSPDAQDGTVEPGTVCADSPNAQGGTTETGTGCADSPNAQGGTAKTGTGCADSSDAQDRTAKLGTAYADSTDAQDGTVVTGTTHTDSSDAQGGTTKTETAYTDSPNAQGRRMKPETACADSPHLPPESIPRLLSSPNDILGIEYCKAILRLNSRIEPAAILRRGSAHHEVSPAGEDTLTYPSATALRELLEDCGSHSLRQNFLRLSQGVPGPVLSLIRDAVPLQADDFSVLLSQRLLTLQLYGRPLTDFYDVPEDLAARIGRRTLDFSSFTQRTAALKTRQYTYTRVSRALLHILLDITAEEAQSRKEHGFVPYIRILGFLKSAEPLLSAIKKAAPLPLITKTADAASFLDPYALKMFRRDLYRSHLYQSVLTAKSGKRTANEYTASVIVLP